MSRPSEWVKDPSNWIRRVAVGRIVTAREKATERAKETERHIATLNEAERLLEQAATILECEGLGDAELRAAPYLTAAQTLVGGSVFGAQESLGGLSNELVLLHGEKLIAEARKRIAEKTEVPDAA